MADAELVTVYHPILPDVSSEVEADTVDAWTEQGWLKSKPRSAAAQAAREASPDVD